LHSYLMVLLHQSISRFCPSCIIIIIIIIVYFLAFPVYKNKIKYVVDRRILWKLEVAIGQQKSAQAWYSLKFYLQWLGLAAYLLLLVPENAYQPQYFL
jgi:hypothetical protein